MNLVFKKAIHHYRKTYLVYMLAAIPQYVNAAFVTILYQRMIDQIGVIRDFQNQFFAAAIWCVRLHPIHDSLFVRISVSNSGTWSLSMDKSVRDEEKFRGLIISLTRTWVLAT